MTKTRLPLLLPASGWVGGIGLIYGDFLQLAWSPWFALLLIGLAFWKPARVFCLALCLGLFWASITLLWNAHQLAVDDTWVGEPVRVTASIQHIEQQPGRLRLLLQEIERADGTLLNGQARVSWYMQHDIPQIQIGSRITSQVRFRRPANFYNPGAFDYQSYCFDKQIALIGSVRGDPEIIHDDARVFHQIRQRIRQSASQLPAAQGGVILALLLADRSQIPINISDHFMASGASHLLAISGLHIGLVAGWAFFLCRWTLTRREAWIVTLPIQKICLGVGLMVACVYALLAGWPLPAQRATMLLAGAVLAWLLQLRSAPMNTLIAALILILFWDPAAVSSVSLWLSFAATAALLLWAGKQMDRPAMQPLKWIIAMLWISLLAALATLPLIAHAFERISTYTLLANALLVPLFGLVVLPLALLGEFAAACGFQEFSQSLMDLAGTALSPGLQYIQMLYSWPGAKLFIPSPALWASILYITGLILAGRLWLQSQRRGASVAAIISLAAYLVLIVPERSPEQVNFIAWDVGQGASSSLLLPDGHVMVVDAPGYPGSRLNGGSTVAASLRSLGIAHIDVFVVSHAQYDHMGGAERLLDQVRNINELWLADIPANREKQRMVRMLERMRNSGATIRWLSAGDAIDLDGMSVHVLWPPKDFSRTNGNNASLVLSVRLPNVSILLPGDIEKQAEMAMLNQGFPAHDLSLIPHHGSKTSSSRAWVEAVQAPHVIAQTGRGNAYGFPKPEIVKRYTDRGYEIWDTKDGAVIAISNAAGWRLHTWRNEWNISNRMFALQWWLGHI